MRTGMRGWAVVVAVLALGGAVQCGGTTGGNLIQMPFEAGGVNRDVTQPFTTIQGWTITLSAAQIVLGPLYFNVNAPQPSVYRSGVVIVQVTDQFIVDALDPTLQPVAGGADGESGTAVSVEIGFFTAAQGFNDTITLPAPLAADGQQGTAYIAGQASKGGVTIDFAGRVQITSALVSGLSPIDQLARVAGAVVDLNFTKTSGTLQLRVDPTRWFDQVNFCALVTTPVALGGADGGTPDGGAPDGGVSTVPPGAPCAPVPGKVYDWSDINPFNNQVLSGMGGSVGVYQFGLVPG